MDQLSDGVDLKTILVNAPGNPLIWKRFLAEITRQLDCESGFLLVTDLIDSENTHFLYSVHIPQDYREQYERGLNKTDKFNHYISKNPRRIFCNQTEDIDYEEPLSSNFISPCGQDYRLGLSIPCSNRNSLSLSINRKDRFCDDELNSGINILQDIIAALDEAIHAEQRSKVKSQLFHYIGGHFDGYIMVDHKLNILYSDPVYAAMISQLDCIEITGNRFGMKSVAVEKCLLSLIEKNAEAISIHNQCHSCRIALIPVSSLKNLYQWECYKDGFILTFTDEKDNNPAIGRLMDIYHLSRCEAVCALHFMKTPSIQDIAINTYRSQETVRNHIKHTMQKMDVHNQAELMKKLMTLAAL